MTDAPETCPECKQPNVHAWSVWDGRVFRRCPGCRWSWFTVVKTTEGNQP